MPNTDDTKQPSAATIQEQLVWIVKTLTSLSDLADAAEAAAAAAAERRRTTGEQGGAGPTETTAVPVKRACGCITTGNEAKNEEDVCLGHLAHETARRCLCSARMAAIEAKRNGVATVDANAMIDAAGKAENIAFDFFQRVGIPYADAWK